MCDSFPMLQGFLLALVGLVSGDAAAAWALPADAAMWQEFAVKFAVFMAVWWPGWYWLIYKRREHAETPEA